MSMEDVRLTALCHFVQGINGDCQGEEVGWKRKKSDYWWRDSENNMQELTLNYNLNDVVRNSLCFLKRLTINSSYQ